MIVLSLATNHVVCMDWKMINNCKVTKRFDGTDCFLIKKSVGERTFYTLSIKIDNILCTVIKNDPKNNDILT